MAILPGPRNGITIQKIEAEVNKSPLEKVHNKAKSYSNQKNIVIEGFDFSVTNKSTSNPTFDKKMLNVTDCQDVTIRRCKFSGGLLTQVACNITGEKTKRVTVEYCIFENLKTDLSNGGEPMRIGNSNVSGCIFECIVRNNIFRNNAADPETISIKSANNTVEDNFFINNKSNVVVRHGGLATVRHNHFKGRGGIRLMGYGNKICDNTFEDNPGEDKWAPIIVANGGAAKDPNWLAVNKPSGKKGSSHAIYAQNVNNEIQGNQFKACKKTIVYRKDKSLAPKNLKLTDNKEVTEFETDTVLPPPPPPVIPPTPTPEPEQPTEEPVEGKMCAIHAHAEAKVLQQIWVCKEHADYFRPKLKQLLHDTKAEAAEGTQQPA